MYLVSKMYTINDQLGERSVDILLAQHDDRCEYCISFIDRTEENIKVYTENYPDASIYTIEEIANNFIKGEN